MRTNAQWRIFLLEDGSPVTTDRQGCADSRIFFVYFFFFFSDKSAQPAALQWPPVVNRAECVQACRGVVWGGEIPAKGGKKQLRDLGQFALLLHWLQKHANTENWRGWQRILFMNGALKPFAFLLLFGGEFTSVLFIFLAAQFDLTECLESFRNFRCVQWKPGRQQRSRTLSWVLTCFRCGREETGIHFFF